MLHWVTPLKMHFLQIYQSNWKSTRKNIEFVVWNNGNGDSERDEREKTYSLLSACMFSFFLNPTNACRTVALRFFIGRSLVVVARTIKMPFEVDDCWVCVCGFEFRSVSHRQTLCLHIQAWTLEERSGPWCYAIFAIFAVTDLLTVVFCRMFCFFETDFFSRNWNFMNFRIFRFCLMQIVTESLDRIC